VTVEDWLAALGSAEPAPGGGAAAAMTAAIAASLVEMVTNLTVGRAAYAEHEAHAARVRDRAGQLRREALALSGEDAEAFTALMAAYKLPRADDAQRARRAEMVQQATVRAAEVPLRIAAVAAEVAKLAAELPGRSNPNVLSDVAVAATTAAAALEAAAVNVEINLSGLRDEAVRAALAERLARATDHLIPARDLAGRLRTELSQ
jgi:methenyltetrahydrofolate cyclohydrolase